MSTSYYRLKPPITSVRATTVPNDSHTSLSICVNHAMTGTIALRNEEVADVLRVLADVDGITIHHIGHGKIECDFLDEDIELDTPLISGSGEIVTLEQLGLTAEQLKEYRL